MPTKREYLQNAARRLMTKIALEMETSQNAGSPFPFPMPQLHGHVAVSDLIRLLLKGHLYEYPKADHTADAVVFGIDTTDTLNVLLIERGRTEEPFFGYWALPGGFINMGEDLDQTVLRELKEETGLELTYMEQLYTFSAPERDPRGRVISTAYLGLVRPQHVTIKAADDAAKAQWFPITKLPILAFDHRRIIREGLHRLRSKARWQPMGIDLLPKEFTLTQLQRVYEAMLLRPLDKRTFRRKVLGFGVLRDTGAFVRNGHRPAKLYRFDRDAYQKLVASGLDFEV